MDGWAVNAVITLIVLPILGWYLSRLIKQKDTLEAKAREDWQQGAVERSNGLVARLDRIERCVGEIKGTLNEKLDIDTYAHHEHAIDCDGKDCTARRTSGVIL